MEIALKEKIKRLDKKEFFGKVLIDWSKDITRLVEGKRVLDIGCGYGFLVNALSDKGFQARGIDISKDAIDVGKDIFTGINLSIDNAYRLPFEDNSFDTVIFHESMHHLDYEKAIREADRVCSGPLVVFDPNPNFMVKMCRKLVKHQDEEAPLPQVIKALNNCGYKLEYLKLRDVFAMPLSGGFVGPKLCPDIQFLHKVLIKMDHFICAVLRLLFLQKFFCWRYLIKARKERNS